MRMLAVGGWAGMRCCSHWFVLPLDHRCNMLLSVGRRAGMRRRCRRFVLPLASRSSTTLTLMCVGVMARGGRCSMLFVVGHIAFGVNLGQALGKGAAARRLAVRPAAGVSGGQRDGAERPEEEQRWVVSPLHIYI